MEGLRSPLGSHEYHVPSKYTTILLIFSIASISYTIYGIIYRLYFHPLSKYPGPLLARISPLPIVIALIRGRLPFYIKNAHDKYGPTIRISPNELSFDSEPAWKDIYGSRPGHANFHKDPIHVGSIQAVEGVTTITMADDVTHARQRRALSHAFSTKALLEQEYIVRSYIDTFSAQMRTFAASGSPFDVTAWFAYTTFDIIGAMALGEPFGCLTNSEFHFWVPLISSSIAAGAMEQATRRIATTGSWAQKALLKLVPDSVRKTRRQHLEYSREKILKRISETGSQQRDFLYYLMKQQEGGALNRDEIMVNGALFIIAGTETTAGFLSGLFNQLLRPENAHVLRTLTQEIREAFEKEEDIRFEALVKLPYLSAVIDEGLRIYPSAPIGFTRTVPEGGDTVDGEYVPGGTTVSVCMWAATHSERNFHDPYIFKPERWLGVEKGEGKTNQWGDKLGASNAFSLGPRGCIGRNLSYMEMRLIIGQLLYNNDVEMSGKNEVWTPEGDHKNMRVYTNWLKPPLMVKLTPRKQ